MTLQVTYLDEFKAARGDQWLSRYPIVKIGGESPRKALVKKYAWAVPEPAAIHVIVGFARKIVEIGAGTGYWASLIAAAGGDIVAYDPQPYENGWCDGYWFDVHVGDEKAVLDHQDRALFLCWPPYAEPVAENALKLYKGNKVIYIGEGHGGCTGTDEFHDALGKDWQLIESVWLPQWEGLHDDVELYVRRRVP